MSVEMRCPVFHGRMFGIPRVRDGVECVEISCQSCRVQAQRSGNASVARVLHFYDIYGRLVATEIVHLPAPHLGDFT